MDEEHFSKFSPRYVFARRAYCVGGSPKMMCVRPCVRVYVCTCVAIKNDQVLNGKTSVSKVNGSKRDPKKVHLQDLIARFWDVDEISGNQSNCPKGLLCGRVTKNHVCPSVCPCVWPYDACVVWPLKSIRFERQNVCIKGEWLKKRSKKGPLARFDRAFLRCRWNLWN